MGRKSREQGFQEFQQLRNYQWEFLRRNSEYRRDFEKLMEQFGDWFKKKGFWYQLQRGDAEYTLSDLVFYYNRICPALKRICQEWCISDPFSPDWTFENGFHAYAPGRLVSLPTGYTAEHAAFLWNMGPVEVVRGNKKGPFAQPFRTVRGKKHAVKAVQGKAPAQRDSRYVLSVDVSRPQKEVLAEVVKAIRLHHDRLSRSPKTLVAKSSTTRRRLDQYLNYLRVWDLRKAGRSFREIAQQVYPKEYLSLPKPRNPIVQKVTDHFYRAQELIHGGYKELR